jgi:hypothetical protein
MGDVTRERHGMRFREKEICEAAYVYKQVTANTQTRLF